MTQRDGQYRSEMFGMVYDQAQRGLRLHTPEAIHGSLLGYKELFLEGKMVREPIRSLPFRHDLTLIFACSS